VSVRAPVLMITRIVYTKFRIFGIQEIQSKEGFCQTKS